jgi:adenylate cyclase
VAKKEKIYLSGKHGLFLSLTVLLIMLVVYFSAPDVFEAIELRLLDWRFRLRGPRDPGSLVKLILADTADRHHYGMDIVFRDKLAGVLEQVCADGARVVGLDLYFSGDVSRAPNEATRHLIRAVDQCGNVVMGFNWSYGSSSSRLARAEAIGRRRLLDAARSSREPGFTPDMIPEKAQVADPAVVRHATAIGYFTIMSDAERRAHKVPAAQVFQRSLFFPFSLAVVRAYLRPKGLGLSHEPNQAPISELDLGRLELRPDPQGYLWLSFYGAANVFPYLRFGDAVENGVPADFARGSIVLIGVSGDDSGDLFDTPFSAGAPGIVLHATAVANALSSGFLVRDLPVRAIEITILVLCALLMGLLIPRLPPLPAIVLGPVLIAGVLLFSGTLFQRSGIWVQLLCPLLEIILLHLSLMSVRMKFAERSAFLTAPSSEANRSRSANEESPSSPRG